MLLQLTSGLLFLTLLSPALAEPPILHVATSEYPPFEYVEDGTLVGEDVTTIRNVLDRMGMEPVFLVVPWRRAEARVRSGQSDMLFSLTHSEERARHYYFTAPINTAQDVFFTRTDSNIEWQTLDDLEGLRLGLSSSYSYAPEFMNWLETADIEIIWISQHRPDLTGLRMVAYDRIDLFICEQTVCHFLLEKFQPVYPELANIEAVPGMIGDERAFRAAFSRKHPDGEQLRDRFNQALADLNRENSD
ncbi:amino acid ABC transporter substrate-binding protein [Marinobacter sp. NP-4(2019)]|uniref:substrate-binding periplasmic protein n=1 Tax=Marinobacter sp. NP-4(2019) TaxID=2488665 RepID=UPI000FC3D3AA|nr:transporter substrate-binding domain-containing protein [Marinobacter sp. NP-4(2019)]AZT85295.1 amino acid ABC transporter substrate-binding protein [Marinobacter sp. NP-4(2019)]